MNKKEIFIVCSAFVLAIVFVTFFIYYGNKSNEMCKMQDGKSGKCVLRSQCNDTRDNIEECGSNVNKICCLTAAKLFGEDSHDDDEAMTSSVTPKNNGTSFILVKSNNTISSDSLDFAVKALLLNDRKLCGEDKTDRIFKGDITSPSEFPFMASLKYKKTPNGKKGDFNEEFGFFCGGSLVAGLTEIFD